VLVLKRLLSRLFALVKVSFPNYFVLDFYDNLNFIDEYIKLLISPGILKLY
jgi:hypothetical protein